MNTDRCGSNLERLSDELQRYLEANHLDESRIASGPAGKIAREVPLAHSTSGTNMAAVCRSGRLYSPRKLHESHLKTLKPEAVEITLGTTNFVFLYAGPFSFPSSGCGFLFSTSLEGHHATDGLATPFDSGGLVGQLRSASEPEKPEAFFERHELPVPGHRDYLRICIGSLFGTPFDYIDGTAPEHSGPLALIGSDARRWTHEVRIPDEVFIRSPHLKAVFAPRRLGLVPEIKSLLGWCLSEGFDVEVFDADRENDFARLREACIEYLRKELT